MTTTISIDEWRASHQNTTVDELAEMIRQASKPWGRLETVSGSDNRMDCRDISGALNKLPVRCEACGFPDIDHVADPYYIIRSRAKASNDLAAAELGNFFVSDRVRAIIELTFSGACRFVPTYFEKSKEISSWHLAVPEAMPRQRPEPYYASLFERIPRCAVCGEPASAHRSEFNMIELGMARVELRLRGKHTEAEREAELSDLRRRGVRVVVTEAELAKPDPAVIIDIAKSLAWVSQELDLYGHPMFDAYPAMKSKPGGWKAWIQRSIYLSNRVLNLFKAAKVKGLYPHPNSNLDITPDERTWVAEQTERLRDHGLMPSPSASKAVTKSAAFEKCLKNHHDSTLPSTEVSEAFGSAPPASYLKFMTTVGPWTFDDPEGEEGRFIRVVGPGEIDNVTYRLGKIGDDEETQAVDGVMFAVNESGDAYCFDLAQPGAEYPVVIYNHEMDDFESYAASFIDFIERVLTVE